MCVSVASIHFIIISMTDTAMVGSEEECIGLFDMTLSVSIKSLLNCLPKSDCIEYRIFPNTYHPFLSLLLAECFVWFVVERQSLSVICSDRKTTCGRGSTKVNILSIIERKFVKRKPKQCTRVNGGMF